LFATSKIFFIYREMKKAVIVLLGIISLLTSCKQKEVASPARSSRSSPEQLAWHEMETNAFIHLPSILLRIKNGDMEMRNHRCSILQL